MLVESQKIHKLVLFKTLRQFQHQIRTKFKFMMDSLLPHILLLQHHSKLHAMVLETQEPLKLQVHLKSLLLMIKATVLSKELLVLQLR